MASVVTASGQVWIGKEPCGAILSTRGPGAVRNRRFHDFCVCRARELVACLLHVTACWLVRVRRTSSTSTLDCVWICLGNVRGGCACQRITSGSCIATRGQVITHYARSARASNGRRIGLVHVCFRRACQLIACLLQVAAGGLIKSLIACLTSTLEVRLVSLVHVRCCGTGQLITSLPRIATGTFIVSKDTCGCSTLDGLRTGLCNVRRCSATEGAA
jgi:hypothetical protein